MSGSFRIVSDTLVIQLFLDIPGNEDHESYKRKIKERG